MTTTSYRTPAEIARRAIERFEIHDAVCRYRKQGSACSTCAELHERACRAYYAAQLAEAA